MPNYYSQNGEDVLLTEIFKDKDSGFFVEVGCVDGRQYSNTLTFEERGWKGMCIEAHAGYIDLLRQNRPNSIICHCAAGENDEDNVPFYANSLGSLSTLDRSRESHFRETFGEFFTGFEEQQVDKRTLNTLFRQHDVTEVDFISVDVEGYEVEVLKGLDLSKYKPRVLLIESENREHRSRLDSLLYPKGYIRSVKVSQNIFYLRDRRWDRKIKNKLFDVELIHTRLPVEGGGEDRTRLRLDTTVNTHRRSSVAKRLLNKMKDILRMYRNRT